MVFVCTPGSMPIFPDKALITGAGASTATLIIETPFFRWGTPIRPNMYSPYWCRISFSFPVEDNSSTMIPTNAILVSIASSFSTKKPLPENPALQKETARSSRQRPLSILLLFPPFLSGRTFEGQYANCHVRVFRTADKSITNFFFDCKRLRELSFYNPNYFIQESGTKTKDHNGKNNVIHFKHLGAINNKISQSCPGG